MSAKSTRIVLKSQYQKVGDILNKFANYHWAGTTDQYNKMDVKY